MEPRMSRVSSEVPPAEASKSRDTASQVSQQAFATRCPYLYKEHEGTPHTYFASRTIALKHSCQTLSIKAGQAFTAMETFSS